MRAARGQSTIELVILLPALLTALAGIAWSVLAVWTSIEATDAARAGARAAILGADPTATARAALPDALRGGASILVAGEGVRVRVRVPAFVPLLDVEVEGAAG
jgi:Flp pilus assembly protein TadG